MEDVAARTLGRVAANDIELAYETFGDAGAPPVVLIMGLATQMIAWPDELCEGLAQRGLFVVRFDNRDVGESTHLRNLPPPRLADIVVRRRPPPYSISDMARDVAGLIDGLRLGEVHLVGASMGGFIAQTVALEHAARVRTLTLMMTSTGSRRVGQPRPRVYARLLRRRVSGDKSFVLLKRQVDADTAQKINRLGLAGITQIADTKRFYPEGESAAHVVGFTNNEDHGQEGVELAEIEPSAT